MWVCLGVFLWVFRGGTLAAPDCRPQRPCPAENHSPTTSQALVMDEWFSAGFVGESVRGGERSVCASW